MTKICSVLTLLGFAASASAATVKPASVEASSFLERDGEYFEARYLTDGKADKAWIEGAEGSGLGSWFKIDLPASTKVASLKIWNGYWITPTYWGRYNRAKEIEVEVGEGQIHKFTLKDEMTPEVVRFPAPVNTSSIRIKIKAIYSGNTYNDTGFSEIQVMDTLPMPYVQPSLYGFSTVLGPEYGPETLSDGIKDTMWCEGNAESDGTGEWIEFDFGQTRTVSKLKMINGVGSGVGDFFNANHATAIKLEFSDGSSWTGSPRGSLMAQTLTFPVKRASKVKMIFTGVKKGKKYNDLCISEAVFMP